MSKRQKHLKPYTEQIRKWLDGKSHKKDLKWEPLCPDWFLGALDAIEEVDRDDPFEQGGWEGNYWGGFSYKNKRFNWSCCAFYGQASISEDLDYEDEE